MPDAAPGRLARRLERPAPQPETSALGAEGVLVPRTALTRVIQLLAVFSVGLLAGAVLAFHL